MYTLVVGDESITLRPENTAPLVRAFLEHSLHRTIAEGFPERYYYLGPMFRHERPQKGRQRQFHQIGAEVLGSASPLADAETIQMLWSLLVTELRVIGPELRINSLGDEVCRPRYRQALVEWIEPRLPQLCGDCQRRFRQNPLRMLDCKVEADRRILEQAPRPVQHLCPECALHYAAVRAALEEYGIPFEEDSGIVRGLDYYQRTVFEVVCPGLGAQDSLLGGGRYDGLVQELGGPRIPGFGFAMGIERLLLVLPDADDHEPRPDVFVVAVDEPGFGASVSLAKRLRELGVTVLAPIAMRPVSSQLKRMNRSRARFAIFVGESEMREGTYKLKDLDRKTEESLSEGALGNTILATRAQGNP